MKDTKQNAKQNAKQHTKKNTKQSSPDNSGILNETPKPLDEAAAEVNRDVGVLMKEFPKNLLRKSRKKAS
jgi:hypothetical protein